VKVLVIFKIITIKGYPSSLFFILAEIQL